MACSGQQMVKLRTESILPSKRLLLTGDGSRASSLSFRTSACILHRSRIAHR